MVFFVNVVYVCVLLMMSFPLSERDEDVRDRDDIRRERHKDRQRDRNLARAGADKRNRIQRERERDVSEKIALGLPNTAANRGDSEAMFDQRLFNKERVSFAWLLIILSGYVRLDVKLDFYGDVKTV